MSFIIVFCLPAGLDIILCFMSSCLTWPNCLIMFQFSLPDLTQICHYCFMSVSIRPMRKRREILEHNMTEIPHRVMLSEVHSIQVCLSYLKSLKLLWNNNHQHLGMFSQSCHFSFTFQILFIKYSPYKYWMFNIAVYWVVIIATNVCLDLRKIFIQCETFFLLPTVLDDMTMWRDHP